MDWLEKIKNNIPAGAISFLVKSNLSWRFLTKRRKINTIHDFKEPFFIIGFGRSGNTLLRSMLVAGDEVVIPPESYVLPRLIKLYKTYDFLPWNELSALLIGEFEAYKEFYTWETDLSSLKKEIRTLPKEKQTLSNLINEIYATYSLQKYGKIMYWGDKTPVNTRFIDKVYEIYPKAKYIYMKRDPKDAIASAVKNQIFPDTQTAAKIFLIYYRKTAWLKKKLPEDQFLEVEYESLVSNTEEVLQNVSKFLDINYKSTMLNFWKNADNLGDTKVHTHHKNISKPINANSIGKWRKTLSAKEAKEIDAILAHIRE